LIYIIKDSRIATQPATTDFDVCKATKVVVMLISLGTPGRPELKRFIFAHLTERIDLASTMTEYSFWGWNWDANISPEIWGS